MHIQCVASSPNGIQQLHKRNDNVPDILSRRRPDTAAAFQNLAVHRSASVEGASRILAPNTRAISPGEVSFVLVAMCSAD